ncbi:hypothetical protein ACOSP7_017475 [Xanthoceras sorbifolium]
MKSGESVIDYFSQTMAIVNKMRIHGDKSENVIIVENIILSMTPKFNFVKINQHQEEIEDEAKAESADKSNIECYRCHSYGHYQSECRTNLNKQNGERTNFAKKEEEVSLLMVCHVNEETQQNMWYLDTGCSNHMCGDKKVFSDLDKSFRNIVKFGDNSTVSIMGKG